MTNKRHDTIGPLPLAWRCVLFTAHMLVCVGTMLTLPLLHRRIASLNHWWTGRLLRILGVHVQIEGQAPQHAMLAVANHVSWMDILVLQNLFYPAFLSKADIGNWPVIGRFARVTGTVFLERGAYATQHANAQMQEMLANGRSVMLFPEATVHADLIPGRFHARLFAVSVDSEAAVQPIAIHYLPEQASGSAPAHHPLAPWVDSSLGTHFWRLLQLRRLDIRVTFCPPIPAAGHDRRSLAQASHDAISTALYPADPPIGGRASRSDRVAGQR